MYSMGHVTSLQLDRRAAATRPRLRRDPRQSPGAQACVSWTYSAAFVETDKLAPR